MIIVLKNLVKFRNKATEDRLGVESFFKTNT